MKLKNKTLPPELLANAKELGFIQVSDHLFQYGLNRDFKVDLSASGISREAILKNALKQAVEAREAFRYSLQSVINNTLKSSDNYMDSSKKLADISYNLNDRNSELVSCLIELFRTNSVPTLEQIEKLQ